MRPRAVVATVSTIPVVVGGYMLFDGMHALLLGRYRRLLKSYPNGYSEPPSFFPSWYSLFARPNALASAGIFVVPQRKMTTTITPMIIHSSGSKAMGCLMAPPLL